MGGQRLSSPRGGLARMKSYRVGYARNGNGEHIAAIIWPRQTLI